MAELVGVVAAAAQLATACLSLLDATKRIKAASSTLRKYQIQLENLQQISLRITENPIFQTPEVETQTQFILLIVKESSLTLFREKSRLFQAWTLVRQERTLLENFNSLERHKTSLLLVLDSIQASALHKINANITNMSQKTASSTADGRPPAFPEPNPFAMPFINLGTVTDAVVCDVKEYTGRPSKMDGDSPEPSRTSSHGGPGASKVMNFTSSTAKNYNQINGYSIQVDPGMEQGLADIILEGSSNHSFPTIVGSGMQVNGLMVECNGKPKGFRVPGVDITCFGAQAISLASGNTVVGGTQVNGTHLRIRAASGSTTGKARK